MTDAEHRDLLDVLKAHKGPVILSGYESSLYNDKICLQAVCGYVSNLRSAIERGDLVAMRRHERGDTYIDSFRNCAERLRAAIAEAATAAQQAPQEDVQLSIFGW